VVEVDGPNPFYPAGAILHGHEFHYSAVTGAPDAENIGYAFSMKRGHGIRDGRDGITYKNVLGTYTHVHALGATAWVTGLVAKAKEYKENSKFKENISK
jgi:cobyrinic acid a,c-diamide synthase